MPELSSSPLCRAVRATLRAAVGPHGELEVAGEHMPASGPTMIACHPSDPIVDLPLRGAHLERLGQRSRP